MILPILTRTDFGLVHNFIEIFCYPRGYIDALNPRFRSCNVASLSFLRNSHHGTLADTTSDRFKKLLLDPAENRFVHIQIRLAGGGWMSDSDTMDDARTVAMLIAALEKRTGMALAGLSQEMLNAKLREWIKSHPAEVNVSQLK